MEVLRFNLTDTKIRLNSPCRIEGNFNNNRVASVNSGNNMSIDHFPGPPALMQPAQQASLHNSSYSGLHGNNQGNQNYFQMQPSRQQQ